VLGRFVKALWVYEGYTQPTHKKERLLPDGSLAMVFNLREDKVRVYDHETGEKCDTIEGSIVCGPHSRYFVIDTEEQRDVAGIQFEPGGAYPFLGLPSGEMLNQHVGLSAIWGRCAGEMRERLLGEPTVEGKLRVMENCLFEAAGDAPEQNPAVQYAIGEFHGATAETSSVAEVTERIGLSPRRFIEVFQKEVGLTPKVFCRVRRFQKVLRQVQRGGEIDWAQIALDCGYYDQAHFIHDFRTFSGINPSTYLAMRTEHLNHVPMAEPA
jgi:AraC-like DNA-binding protein